MKKLLTLALAVVLLFCMVGCSGESESEGENSPATETTQTNLPLPGTWIVVKATIQGITTDAPNMGSVVFCEDGTLTMNDTVGNSIKGTWTKIDDENISILIESMYQFSAKLDGKTLTVDQSSMPGGMESVIYEKQ